MCHGKNTFREQNRQTKNKKSKSREKSLEGEVVTARNWKEYSDDLKISPEFLKNKAILNLGSGYSNLRADLKKIGN